MGTLYGSIAHTVQDFEKRRRDACKDEASLKDIEQQEIEFWLRAFPYVKKLHDEGDDDDSKKRVMNKTLLTEYKHDVEHDLEAGIDVCRVAAKTYGGECERCDGTVCVDANRCVYTCVSCGFTKAFFLDATYDKGVPFEQKSQYTASKHPEYKKINHFVDTLTKIQGKEAREIPEQVLAELRAELKKNRITDGAKITPLLVRKYLVKLKHRQFYPHMYKIAEHLGGLRPPKFTVEFENTLKNMFLQAQEPFEKCKPTDRKNMLSYPYLIYKFCELLGADEHLPYLRLLKGDGRLAAMDQIYKKMCDILGWEFIPSSNDNPLRIV